MTDHCKARIFDLTDGLCEGTSGREANEMIYSQTAKRVLSPDQG
jgi:hypothetical protein